jgi:hypothetical protein
VLAKLEFLTNISVVDDVMKFINCQKQSSNKEEDKKKKEFSIEDEQVMTTTTKNQVF